MYDIVSDVFVGIFFRSFIVVGFWVVTAYIKGMHVVYELIIDEQYINPLK